MGDCFDCGAWKYYLSLDEVKEISLRKAFGAFCAKHPQRDPQEEKKAAENRMVESMQQRNTMRSKALQSASPHASTSSPLIRAMRGAKARKAAEEIRTAALRLP